MSVTDRDERSIAWADAYSCKVQAESIKNKVTGLLIEGDNLSKVQRETLRYMLSSVDYILEHLAPLASVR